MVVLLGFPGLMFANTVTVSLASVGTAANSNQTNSTGNASVTTEHELLATRNA